MEAYEPYLSFGLALVAGFLIGLEREQAAVASDKAEGTFFGGARTFPIVAMIGAISALLSRHYGNWIVIISFMAIIAYVGISYYSDVTKDNDHGLSSEAAIALTFLLGVFAMSEDLVRPVERKVFVVLAVSVITTLLLSVKSPLRSFAAKATQDDVLATVKFLVIAVVALPLLPDRTMGPLDVLNPYKVGLMIVLIAGVSFVGYVAIRVLGPGRGLGITGLVGGLASSTAVTLGFSRRAKEEPALAPACALAVVLASTVMYARILVLVAVLNMELLWLLLLPVGSMMLFSMGASAFIYRETKEQAPSQRGASRIEVSNPFELRSAVGLGILFAVVLFISKAATQYGGAGGTYLTGLLAGATDLDAVTLSMANLAKKGLSANIAVTTILIAIVSNTAVKGGMALSLGGRALGKRVLAAFGVSIAGGFLGWLWFFFR